MKCIECGRKVPVNDRGICRSCWYEGLRALDWLAYVRRYGIEAANIAFPVTEEQAP